MTRREDLSTSRRTWFSVAAVVFALIFGIALVVWPARAAVTGLRRARRRPNPAREDAPDEIDVEPRALEELPRPTSRLIRVARVVALVAIGLDIAFMAGMLVGLSHIPANTILRNLGLLRADGWVLTVATIGGFVAVTLIVLAASAILLRAGSRMARVHLGLVATAGLIFSGTLLYYGVI